MSENCGMDVSCDLWYFANMNVVAIVVWTGLVHVTLLCAQAADNITDKRSSNDSINEGIETESQGIPR